MVLYAAIGQPSAIVYLGERLDNTQAYEQLRTLRSRTLGDGSPQVEIPITLLCDPGSGSTAPPGIALHRDGEACQSGLVVKAVTHSTDALQIVCGDERENVLVTHDFRIDATNTLVCTETTITNGAGTPLVVDWLSVLCIPLDPMLTDAILLSGRWAGEFKQTRQKLSRSGFVCENRRGRTSHDQFPGVVLCESESNERAGQCIGVHLGWSGNHRIRVEKLADGRCLLQVGELFLPGEIRLEPGQSYTTPTLFTAFSSTGLSDLSASFHGHYRENIEDSRVKSSSRPVHYNSWEAIYFDHEPVRLLKLIDEAAEIGIERFVLDDGWFRGRRDDTAGLGDWTVDDTVYPEGLEPIIDHVHAQGMEFGLWVEPEMVNVDSDLYRAHPEWILGPEPSRQLPFRNQFVLDLARDDVAEFLYRQLDALLARYQIAYLKWDMNRDLNHPHSSDGAPSAHRQTHAVYALLDRLRTQHATVEIESCSSGGGRIDFGILKRTDRVWTSDSNDALDRQLIQRGASNFFPLSILGSHVGPARCKITHRKLPMSLRAATAMFGHMGVEADLFQLSADERDELKQAIGLYKQHRELIHKGRFVRVDASNNQNIVGVVSADSRQALFSIAQVATNPDNLPGILRFYGLDPRYEYDLQVLWPAKERFPQAESLGGVGWNGPETFSGELLVLHGIQLPLMHPEQCLIYELRAST